MSACAEGEETPWEALASERKSAGRPGNTLQGSQPSERRCADVFDFRTPSVSQENPKVGAQANDEGGARNQCPRYLLTGMTSEREAKPRRGGAGRETLVERQGAAGNGSDSGGGNRPQAFPALTFFAVSCSASRAARSMPGGFFCARLTRSEAG